MKQILLNNSMVAFVDDDMYESVAQYNWVAEQHRNTWYASSNLGSGREGSRIRLHQFIMGDEVAIVDHKDRNGLNCVRDNMRAATTRDNGRNAPRDLGEVPYRGVTVYHRDNSRFIVRIRDNEGNKLHLGIFDTAEDGARAYDEAAKLYHGEFATLNFS